MGASALVPSNERSTAVGETPRPLDATIVAGNAKILRIFCESPYTEKIFAYWPPAALRGPSRGGNVARCIAEGVTTPLEKSLPMVADTVAIVKVNRYPFFPILK